MHDDVKLPARTLSTDRLILRASAPSQYAAVSDFHQRNGRHFAPWSPPQPPGFWDYGPTRDRLAREADDFDDGRLWRYWISLKASRGSGLFVHTEDDLPEASDGEHRVIGQCQISQISRGVYQSAMLGYSLDEQAQGRGLMHEAVRRVIQEIFSPAVWLHRLQASVRPDNAPSLRVLQRLGFQREGVCPRYLFIDGRWRDHETHALLNPAWDDEQAPR
ncbi:GNAT family N-acetyltransferase [Roseateles amylovorans]|uniref:GNAT family N-acetyltransferase n=1 Tax=Roseateles amylovorans TaxID=2978473 RepID=A0ABY6B3E8_9BURK|nr:GNAT family protein [Roseateles amylovorans]UXH79754.1 GNAT family N-acetyltransferase [Roseateles amylovorans]